jgi:two-component system nitrogen regulation response regulator GlnG
MPRVLVVDDDRTVLHLVQRSLEKLDLNVLTDTTADGALQTIAREKPDLVLLDVVLPRTTGLEIFHQIQQIDPRLPVIFMTAGAGSDTAIEAMRLGAFDYIAKPLDLPGLNQLVAKALETRRLMSVPVAVATGDDDATDGEVFVGRSPQMLDVFKAIGRVAQQNVTVLVRGESGTGKELVARALYQHSDRAERPFMAVNCAALPDTLLESELFGHEKGSFTGADRRRIGKFEQCNGGTLFLDEVGDMSPLVQGKVLRVLQEQRFERVGGNETIQTSVRLIAATNRDLEQMVEKGKFRADLFYRLNGVTIALPPLRDRRDDVPLLLKHFLTRASRELNKPRIEGVSPEALAVLTAYDWPGNIRELQSVVRQSVLKATGPVIVPDFLPPEVHGDNRRPVATSANEAGAPAELRQFVERRLRDGSTDLYAETLEHMERCLIPLVLGATGGNQTKAAKILGVTRGKLRDRIAQFGITLEKTISVEDADAPQSSAASPA